MQDIRAARFAIFDGHTEIASELMDKARIAINKVEEEAPQFASTTSTVVDGKPVSSNPVTRDAANVPVDGQLMVADDFVISPQWCPNVFSWGASKLLIIRKK